MRRGREQDMKITELLQAKGVKLGARVATQAEAIETLVD